VTLHDHIQRYLELVDTANSLFQKVKASHAALMPCTQGCDDCCSVYFQLSLIEAFVINGYFKSQVDPRMQQEVMKKAADVEPMFQQALRASSTRSEEERELGGKSSDEVLGALRIPCVLHVDGSCLLYEHRPITCRLYGAPQKIGGQVIACPKTGFQRNQAYLSIDVAKINETLHDYSREFLSDLIGLTPTSAAEMLFPLPTALRINFDKEFFTDLKARLQA